MNIFRRAKSARRPPQPDPVPPAPGSRFEVKWPTASGGGSYMIVDTKERAEEIARQARDAWGSEFIVVPK